MPIYEYACQECGKQFEKIQKMSDDPLVDCPVCDGPHLKKLVSAPAFRLKGDGWYETDFKSSKQKNLAGDAAAPSAAPAKTEAKPSSSGSSE